MVPLPLPLLQRLVVLLLLPTFLLHLGLHLPPPPRLRLDQHLDRFGPPFLFKRFALQFRAVERVLVLPDEQGARVRYALVQMFTLRLVEQGGLGLFEAVEGVGRRRVSGFVWMDQEGLFAVLDLDV